MFNGSDANNVEVFIRLADGQSIDGTIVGGVTNNLATILNRPGSFIEVITSGGHKKYLGASHIVSVELARKLTAPAMPKAANASAENAYRILNLEPGCDVVALKERYHEMVKHYHPDRFQSLDMPPEVSRYLNETFESLARARDIVAGEIGKQSAA